MSTETVPAGAAPPTATTAPARLLVLGPQGAGKAVQSERLAQGLGVPHVSTGDLFREAAHAETPLGRQVKGYLERGELVPDEVVDDVVAERLARHDAQERGFVLDGFPRTAAQAEALVAMVAPADLDLAVWLDVPAEVLLGRLALRRVCRKCGEVYSAERPDRESWACERCGGPVERREDDTPEAIARRLQLSAEQAEPLTAWLSARGNLVVVDGTGTPDEVAEQVLAAVRPALERRRGRPGDVAPRAGRSGAEAGTPAGGRLAALDLSLGLSRKEEERRLKAAQLRLLQLRLVLGGLVGDGTIGPPVCVLFEGWDASGKGGAIRRLVAPLDPRHVRVASFGAPTYDEKRHHFLLRFGPVLPGWGGMAIMDRTWYGRVLVERVEGFATEEQWSRAYDEIANHERTLAAEGMILVKFWMHISHEEQLRRFERRQRDVLKSWKLTDEDWRNRDKRAEYEAAVEEMLERTDHGAGRWHLVEAESKRYARVKVLETTVADIEAGMRTRGFEPPDPAWAKEMARRTDG